MIYFRKPLVIFICNFNLTLLILGQISCTGAMPFVVFLIKYLINYQKEIFLSTCLKSITLALYHLVNNWFEFVISTWGYVRGLCPYACVRSYVLLFIISLFAYALLVSLFSLSCPSAQAQPA